MHANIRGSPCRLPGVLEGCRKVDLVADWAELEGEMGFHDCKYKVSNTALSLLSGHVAVLLLSTEGWINIS